MCVYDYFSEYSKASLCSSHCCGPSFFGYNSSEWCDASLPSWVTVPLNGKSDTFFLDSGGMKHVLCLVNERRL